MLHVTRYASRVTCYALLLIPLLLLISCGKKGPPTLREYEKPSAPSGLTAIHREDKMTLSWSYPRSLEPALRDFLVLRSEGKGFERAGAVKIDERVFVDNTFQPDITYSYKVIARNLKGVVSDDSNVVIATPRRIPGSPKDLRFAVRAEGVELSWDSSGEGACYNIYRSMEKGKYSDTPLNGQPLCATSYRDGSLFPEGTVYYTVRALYKTPVRDEGYASPEIEVNPSHFIPSPPSDLRVVVDDMTFLTWKESPEPWVRGYRVYRKKEGEQEFSAVGETRIPAFTDAWKFEGKVWYMIRALGPVEEGGPLTSEVAR